MRGWTAGSKLFTSAVAETIPCNSPKERTEEPAAGAARGEDREVDEREDLAGRQVHEISDCLGTRTIAGDGCPEEEGQVDAGQAQLVRRPQAGRQHECADEATGKSAPHAHSLALAIETAALISARCTRPWGMFPNGSPVRESTSSQ
jgi:hypothetical protein